MELYLGSILIELEAKFFARFKKLMVQKEFSRRQIINDFKGMNKDVLYSYFKSETTLSLNQASEILLENVLNVEKNELIGNAIIFYELFHKVFKIRDKRIVVSFCENYRKFRGMKFINGFTQTIIDVAKTKEDVINLFLNLQPKSFKEDK